jgi:hypothetical protein
MWKEGGCKIWWDQSKSYNHAHIVTLDFKWQQTFLIRPPATSIFTAKNKNFMIKTSLYFFRINTWTGGLSFIDLAGSLVSILRIYSTCIFQNISGAHFYSLLQTTSTTNQALILHTEQSILHPCQNTTKCLSFFNSSSFLFTEKGKLATWDRLQPVGWILQLG